MSERSSIGVDVFPEYDIQLPPTVIMNLCFSVLIVLIVYTITPYVTWWHLCFLWVNKRWSL